MPQKVLNGLQLTSLTADPSGWAAGSVYWNSTDSVVRSYDGTLWSTVGSKPFANMPGSELNKLTLGTSTMTSLEYGASIAAGGSQTIYTSASGTYGVVEKVTVIGLGAITCYGYLRISYDGGTTFPFTAELGTLFGAYPESYTAGAGPVVANCAHMLTQQMRQAGGTTYAIYSMNYPIPYTNGIVIQIYNPTSSSFNGMYSDVTASTCTSASQVPPYQLRCTGTNMQTLTATSAFTFTAGTSQAAGVGGYTINTANQSMLNPLTSGATTVPLSLTNYQIAQLAKITGKGWIVGLAYVDQIGSGYTSLERDFAWYIDGATQPVIGGVVTTPTNGAPTGTGVGSPTICTSGTEDTFESAFYVFDGYQQGGVMSNPAANPVSGTAYSNNWGVPIDVYIQAVGPVSSILLQSTTLPMTVSPGGSTMVRLPPGLTLTVNFQGTAPNWQWVASESFGGGPLTSYSQPTSMLTGSGSAASAFYYEAYLDILETCGGYRYTTSCNAWLLTEGHNTDTQNASWCMLYYADLS